MTEQKFKQGQFYSKILAFNHFITKFTLNPGFSLFDLLPGYLS